MKLFGAILIILGAGTGGVLMARALRERVINLQQFVRGFQMLKVEIGYGLCPLETAFRRIASTLGQGVGDFFEAVSKNIQECGNVQEAWSETILKFKDELALSESDWVAVESISPFLGVTDLEHQIKVFHEAAERLKVQEDEAEHKAVTNERVFRYAGFALGVMLVLVLY